MFLINIVSMNSSPHGRNREMESDQMPCWGLSGRDKFQSHFHLSTFSSFFNLTSTPPHPFTKLILLRLSIISTSSKWRSNYQSSTYSTSLKHSLLLACVIPHSPRYSLLLLLSLSLLIRGSNSSRVAEKWCTS